MAINYLVLVITEEQNPLSTVFTLEETHYGRVLPVLLSREMLEDFQSFATSRLKTGQGIYNLGILAETFDQAELALRESDLLPLGTTLIAIEGTEFFDEIFAQLITNTLWRTS
jgi:hypothetical protein